MVLELGIYFNSSWIKTASKWHGNCIFFDRDYLKEIVLTSQSVINNTGSLFNISYMDNYGNVSSRRIKVLSVYTSSYGIKYIRAWCYLRNEERTFRADRIISISGEEKLKNSIYKEPVQKSINRPIYKEPVQETVKAVPSKSFSESCSRISADINKQNTSVITEPGQAKKTSSGSDFIGYIFSFFMTLFILSRFGIYFIDIMPYESSNQNSTAYFPPVSSENSSNQNKREITVPSTEIIVKQDRVNSFRTVTGIISIILENIYQSADLNRDNNLGQNELEVFQEKLYRKYKYINNETALRPDQFLAAGGGDCEDWALFTCGLLRYWGIACAVGHLAEDEYGNGHAVALVYKGNTIPSKGIYYKFNADGIVLSGIYIPVDYNLVGELSNAVDENWSLCRLYVPEGNIRRLYVT